MQLLKIAKAYEYKRIVRTMGKMLPIILETLILNVILRFSRRFEQLSS